MQEMNTMKQLDNAQLATFDTEYVNEARWEIVKSLIDKAFPTGEFTFLDVGGGNGQFADRLLAAYPKALGTVLDNSDLLLERNQPHQRKKLVNASAEDLHRSNQKYDLICLNWLLHHLVGNSYRNSKRNIAATLHSLEPLLTECGRISVFENMYDGIVWDSLPSRLIYELTAFKPLKAVISRMGANTAGVGVCFLSNQTWRRLMQSQRLEIVQFTNDPTPWPIPLLRRIILHLGYIRVGHFWLAPERN
jgi:SAM-dependent methyltransferase